jgi:hypothetical protein
MLVVTEHAREFGLPVDSRDLKAESGGQVKGASGAKVQKILNRHGISRVFSEEGGRTNRGSIRNMEVYVEFLNQWHSDGQVDLEAAERFWVDKVREFFEGKPFRLRADRAKTVRAALRDLFDQAETRKKEGGGTQYLGIVLQHLVGAKLRTLYGAKAPRSFSFSTSDQQSARAGDFEIGDAAIHVTVTPTEALIRKSAANLDSGLRPLIITRGKGVSGAEMLCENANLSGRIEVFDVEQFLASNVLEISEFRSSQAQQILADIVVKYNEIIDEVETDPSLKIDFG